MTYDFRNIVFEGGGVKGIAYLGALEVLEVRQVLQGIQRVGGTSAGAINAIFLGLGFTLKEMNDRLWSFDFKKLLDDSWGVIPNVGRLVGKYGWYKGDYLEETIGEFIRQKTGNSESTFADIEVKKEELGFKSLFFMGTNLSIGLSEVFSAEPEHTPNMCVAEAIRISMSIPVLFASERVLGDVYVDGGVLENYPVKLFDRRKYAATGNYLEPDYYLRMNSQLKEMDEPVSEYVFNKETLGFRLDSREEVSRFRDHAAPPNEKMDNVFDFSRELIRTVVEAQQSYHLHSDDWKRTVYIDTKGVGTIDFDLKESKKRELIKSGKDGTNSFLDWYDKNHGDVHND